MSGEPKTTHVRVMMRSPQKRQTPAEKVLTYERPEDAEQAVFSLASSMPTGSSRVCKIEYTEPTIWRDGP